MSYEKLRNEIAANLLRNRSAGDVANILAVIDSVANGYDITRKSTDLIVADECPQILRLYIASLAVENKSRNTTTDYLRKLRIFFRAVQKPYDAITTNDIRAFLYSYQQNNGVKNSSLDKIRAIINGFYAWCVREEYLIRNPQPRSQKSNRVLLIAPEWTPSNSKPYGAHAKRSERRRSWMCFTQREFAFPS